MGFEVIAGMITNLEQIISFAIQQQKMPVICVSLQTLNRVMPESYRAELPPLPVIDNLKDHLDTQRNYWAWIEKAMPEVYEKISIWQHSGFVEK